MVLTPHLGASTTEAQTRVAEDMARQCVDFFHQGVIRNAVNLDVRITPRLAPYSRLAAILGQMAAQLAAGPVQRVRVSCQGRLSKEETGELGLNALMGLLDRTTGDPVTLVNAPLIAEARGIEVVEYKSEKSPTYASLLTVEVETPSARRVVAGTCFDDEARIVQVDEFLTDVKPAEFLLLMLYPDRPGMVGRFGTILGEADINIADMAVGRREKRGRAMVILTLDDPVPAAVLQRIREAVRVEEMHAISIAL